MEALQFGDSSMFVVVVGSVLWQKVDILNMYGLKEVCSNAYPLHYYVLRVPLKADRWR